jgi:4-hydroxy-4-methyl-2-oxoglutarate aldolase
VSGGGGTLTSAGVAQAAGTDISVCTGLTALLPGTPVDGPAYTCACEPGDNLALHRALIAALAGAVVVCDAAGDSSGGYFGELMTRDALGRGLAGLVISGSIRDTVQIRALGFPVFHAGTNPVSCAKQAVRSVGEPVRIMGACVRPGDQVVADADGVVFVPAASWPAVAAAARRIDEREADLVRRLDAGERLADVLDLPPG